MNLTKAELDNILKNPDVSIVGERTAKARDGVKAKRGTKSQPEQFDPYQRRVVIKMQYPGSVITENHYLGRNGNRSYVKQEAKEWANDLIWEIKRCGVQDWKPPLKIRVEGTFKNDRERCDLHNLKILYDSIQDATGLNDKDYHTETIPGIIDKTVEPFILIRIEELEVK